MSQTLLIPMPGNERLAGRLADELDCETGELITRRFPDGETYLRFNTELDKRSVAIVCTLAHPDDKFLPLIFAAATARELGASKVGLVAPYLAYMRQDRRFNPGEAVTSRQVAHLISGAFDWMVTVDPHLHRYGDLSEIYSIPTRVVHAAPLVSRWIKENVEKPLIIGPDSESEQWVAAVAGEAEAPYCVLEKVRHGDRDVRITLGNLDAWRGRTAVLVDDIISSGRTMIEAVRLLAAQDWPPPVCIAVHGLFADRSDELLVGAGARVVTTNSVGTGRSEIDIASLLGEAMGALADLRPARSAGRRPRLTDRENAWPYARAVQPHILFMGALPGIGTMPRIILRCSAVRRLAASPTARTNASLASDLIFSISCTLLR